MPNVASPPFERMSPDESSAAPASETAMAVNSRREQRSRKKERHGQRDGQRIEEMNGRSDACGDVGIGEDEAQRTAGPEEAQQEDDAEVPAGDAQPPARRHNRARGTHNVELMSEIVAELTRANMSDRWIMRHIGMGRDELLRLKQITGLAELFADREFSFGDPGEEELGSSPRKEPPKKKDATRAIGYRDPPAGEDKPCRPPAPPPRMVLWNGMNRETTARTSETANI